MKGTLLLAIMGAAFAAAQNNSPLDFVTGLTEHQRIRSMLTTHLNDQAARMLESRGKSIERFSGPAEVASRKAYVREHVLAALGGLPERTPLNARIVGALERPNYRIEKVVFQSQPGFFVTANLYLPKAGKPPYPAVLYPLGHEPGGKAYPVWQQMLGALATKGYVALTWDPLGQGERVQLWDATAGDGRVGASTTEHTIMGIQCLLVGDNLARYTIWDGMRALDYLLSRPEVDPTRVGCTGNSGGGTHTAYLSALDDRIHVAAPSCYITSWRKLLTSIGPQDAEQCLPPFLSDSLDHPDFIHAFAPKPYLILSAVRDFFSISGARQTYEEAKRVYRLAGVEEKISMADADDGHGYSKPRRIAAYRWFGRWLKGAEDNEAEPEMEIATARELNCTETGQLATSLGGVTVYMMNRLRAAEAARQRPPVDIAALGRLIGFSAAQGEPPKWPYGTIERQGYRIEKWIYESEPGILIPTLIFVPEGAGRKPGVILVDGAGKSASEVEAEKLAKSGAVVLAADLRGLGETRSSEVTKGGDWNRYFGDYDSAMTALLTGKTLVGLRARDIHSGITLLSARSDVDAERIHGIGRGAGAVPLLHEAVLDGRVKRLLLDKVLVSYSAVVQANLHQGVFENVVRGALRHYDLQDLAASMRPRPVWVVDALDPMERPLPLESVQAEYGDKAARLLTRRGSETAADIYLELIR